MTTELLPLPLTPVTQTNIPDGTTRLSVEFGTLEVDGARTIEKTPDGALTETDSTRLATLRFDNGRVSGSGGCNQLMGNYDLPEGGISIKTGAMTMMACPDGMDQEQAVVSALDRTDFVSGHRTS